MCFRSDCQKMTSNMDIRFSWARRIFRAGATLLLLGLTAQTELQEPFGLPTFVVADGLLPATWEDLREEIEADRTIIARCRARPEDCSSPAALRFIAIVGEGQLHQGLARIGHINRAVNLSIRGIKNAAPADWTSPLTALADGAGDCKQHAILKYAALRDVGLPVELHTDCDCRRQSAASKACTRCGARRRPLDISQQSFLYPGRGRSDGQTVCAVERS